MRRAIALLFALLLVSAIAPQAGAQDIEAVAPAQDPLRDQLEAIPGLTVVSETQPSGYRFFVLTFTQPADHRRPERGAFQQRLTLLHRSTTAPVVLLTNGYGLPANPGPSRTEPTRLLDANQVSVEHRFFTPSRPEPADWTTLNIWQEAADEHAIVRALKTIYGGKWIQTGASKGGMTSVYHRRFFPDDVDATVAYVAPNDRVNPADHAYDQFFAQVADSTCRTALQEVQKELLERRERLVPRLADQAQQSGLTFDRTLGTADRSFELSVLDSVWAFWQFFTAADCAAVPAATASDDELYAWVDAVLGWTFYTDQGLEFYWPYYYQAASQLGWPELRFAHLRGLLRYPGLYAPNPVLPVELRTSHHPRPMLDVDHWVRTRSSRMMFIYGENDPWGAEAFAPSRRDSYRYTAPGANHGANIAQLAASDQEAALATLRRWAGVSEETSVATAPSIPDDDMLPPRRGRLP